MYRRRPALLRAFTIVELLIVIGIIAVLIAILLPVLSSVRRAARDTACLANLHEWGHSFQMYTDDNKGKSFLSPIAVTSLTWYEALEPYNGELKRTLLCPAATDPGNAVGSATQAWGPNNTFDTGAPQWTLRGTYIGSYGFNGWLWRTPDDQTPPPNSFDLPARPASAIPLLADCILPTGLPLDTDTVPTDLQQPLPTSGSGKPGPTGAMAYFCINRHRHRVNAVFLDGHAEPVPLANLWKLQWNRNFIGRDVTVPE